MNTIPIGVHSWISHLTTNVSLHKSVNSMLEFSAGLLAG